MAIYLGEDRVNFSVKPIGEYAEVDYKVGVIRPDAELVKTYSYDKYIVENEEVEIPAYITTAQTLKASVNLTPTYTIDFDNYDYTVLIRTLTIPEYSITTVGKGRVEYHYNSYKADVVRVDANVRASLINPNLKAGRNVAIVGATVGQLMYYSSATAFSVYNTAAYGCYQVITAPAISGTTLTLKSPTLNIRGHTTYLTQTYFDAIDDIRYQWVIEVYRSPRTGDKADGWGVQSQTLKIIDCAMTSTRTLK